MPHQRPPLALLLVLAGCASGPDRSPAPGRAAELLGEGRQLLREGRPEEAQAAFERASALDGGSLESRTWILRAWLEQGRNNDALDAVDALVRGGEQGPETDYLYGMAFERRARDKVLEGTADASVRMNFEDAVSSLSKALESAPERFDDAWPALANAAWMTLDLARAREAAEVAVQRHPEGADEQLLLGRIAFSQFREAYDAGGGWSPASEAAWQRAQAAFRAAGERYDAARAGQDVALADARLQLAHALLWKEDAAGAREALSAAIAAAPDAIDFAAEQPLFDAATFHAALRDGLARWRARPDADPAREAVACWWLGWASWAVGENEQAERELLAALEREPAYTSAWFYVALARYAREDWPGTIEALRAAWQADPAAVVAEVQADLEQNLARLSFVVGWCAREERPADAATVARIVAEAAPQAPGSWNDLGLFLRDQGEKLGGGAQATALYEESLAAYERALELAPDDPQILNDTGVILHYYLERDLERALALYARAQELARVQLEGGAVDPELRPVIETALRDATDNHRRLAQELAEKRG